jgi:adenosyl cobinamide kinase/adenosyl cobinamide phosphate guanylyltransferase
MELEHRDRRLWVDQVADINRRLADAAQEVH